MTESELISLGFEKQEGDDFHYYTYDVVKGLSFISSDNDDSKGDKWTVDFFDTEPKISYNKMEELQILINSLEKHII